MQRREYIHANKYNYKRTVASKVCFGVFLELFNVLIFPQNSSGSIGPLIINRPTNNKLACLNYIFRCP